MLTTLLRLGRVLLGPAVAALAISGAAAADKIVIAHGSQAIELTHPGLFLPNILGWSAEEGLEITVQKTQGSQQALQLLAAGKADIVTLTTQTVLNGREEGVKARLIFSETSHYNAQIAALAEGPYTDVTKFKGTDVGVYSMSSGGDPFLKAVLKENGLNFDTDVKTVPLGAGAAALEALTSGKVSALSLWAGAFAVFDNQGAKLKLFTSKALDTSPGFVVAASDDYIKANPGIIEKVGRLFAKSYVFSAANPEAAVLAYWKALPETKPAEVTPKVISDQKHILEVGLRDMRNDNRADKRYGWNDPSGIDIFQDYLIANGARKVKLPVADLFTNDFVDAYGTFDVAKLQEAAKAYKP